MRQKRDIYFGAESGHPQGPLLTDSVEKLRRRIFLTINDRVCGYERIDDSIFLPALNHCCANRAENRRGGSLSTKSTQGGHFRHPP
jgi:hypothetical protein